MANTKTFVGRKFMPRSRPIITLCSMANLESSLCRQPFRLHQMLPFAVLVVVVASARPLNLRSPCVDHTLPYQFACMSTTRHSGTIGGENAAASRDLICHGHVRHSLISTGTNPHATAQSCASHAASRGLAHAERVIDHLDQVTMATVIHRQ
jgi:hypothetical protein